MGGVRHVGQARALIVRKVDDAALDAAFADGGSALATHFATGITAWRQCLLVEMSVTSLYGANDVVSRDVSSAFH